MPVCAPVAGQVQCAQEAADLKRFTLLHSAAFRDWQVWLTLRG